MNISKPYSLIIPERAFKKISEITDKDKDIYFYILYLIGFRANIYINKTDYRCSEGFVPLDFEKLKLIFGKKADQHLKFMRKHNIIETDDIFIPGKKKLYYRINKEMFNDGLKNYILDSNTNIHKNLSSLNQKAKKHYFRLPSHLKQMMCKLKNMEYDDIGAKKWIQCYVNDNNKAFVYNIAVESIRDVRCRYFKRNSVNRRLDTNLTNLKSELRKFIKGNFVSIDLANSQFLFLAILIYQLLIHSNDNIKDIPLCCYIDINNICKNIDITNVCKFLKNPQNEKLGNYSKFLNWVVNGKLYDNFMEYFKNQYTRKEVKEIMFKVLFSQNKSYMDDKKVFKQVFPFIYNITFKLKQKEHNKLAICLQKMESEIFIDCIAKKLVESGIVPFTIHDSVIVEKEHQQRALELIQGVFKEKFNIVPTFKVEDL